MDDEIKSVIEETVSQTVLRLKMTGLMKDDGQTITQKTESVLRNYEALKCSTEQYAIKVIERLELALESIKDDKYYEIIPMVYFEGRSRESVAEYFDTTVTTISRNKARLVSKLEVYLFADDFVRELFS